MNLQERIESLEARIYSPSDSPLAQLSQTELDSLLTLINYRNLESIYPFRCKKGCYLRVSMLPNQGSI
ncbi:hypothetical protein [Moorena producens]|uniref:hypothetical protein n=1 Tax=Moorena producens TaxID=1155739 RepID=UPI003C707F9C